MSPRAPEAEVPAAALATVQVSRLSGGGRSSGSALAADVIGLQLQEAWAHFLEQRDNPQYLQFHECAFHFHGLGSDHPLVEPSVVVLVSQSTANMPRFHCAGTNHTPWVRRLGSRLRSRVLCSRSINESEHCCRRRVGMAGVAAQAPVRLLQSRPN